MSGKAKDKRKAHLVSENLLKQKPCRPAYNMNVGLGHLRWCEMMSMAISSGLMVERRGDVFAGSKVALGVAALGVGRNIVMINFCPWCGGPAIAWEKKS